MVGQVIMPDIYGAVTGGMEDGRIRAAKNALAQAVQQGGPTSPGAINALSALDPGRAAAMSQQAQQFDASQAQSASQFGETMGFRNKQFDYGVERDNIGDRRAQASAGAAAGRAREAQTTSLQAANAKKGAALIAAIMQAPEANRGAAWQQGLQIAAQMGLSVEGLPQQYPGDEAAGMIYSQLSGSAMPQPDVPKGVVVNKRLVNPQTGEVMYQQDPNDPGAEDAPEYGLNPIMAVAEDGTRVAIQISKTGQPRIVDIPPGLKITGQTFRVDTGTEVVNADSTTGAVISVQPKNVAGAAGEAVLGKAAGEEQAKAPRSMAQADTMLSDIDAILKDPGLENATGWGSYVPFDIPGFNAETRSRLNKLDGQAFLQAYDALRGTGTITEIEGAKAESAMARLNRAQSPDEFRRALSEFRDVVSAARERSARRLPGASSGGNASPQRILRYNANTGALE
jgi:hypothetical protein